MAILIWIFVPLLTGGGAVLLVSYIMRCRMEEAVARERTALSELQSALVVQRVRLENAIDDAKAAARRAAFDEFLDDFQVEQERYIRKSRLLFMSRQTLVLRERILFRNLPLSDWVENEMTFDETVGAHDGALTPPKIGFVSAQTHRPA